MTNPEPGKYRHYKRGDIYEVIGIAEHADRKSHYVVYRACYGKKVLYVRPLKVFGADVNWQGNRQPRFQKL